VGGKNKVEMSRLREVFAVSGMESVGTYINSGNVVFVPPVEAGDGLAELLEAAILDEFGFEVRVLLRDLPGISRVTAAMPDTWVTGPEMRCDVLFLWESVDTPGLIETIDFNPEIEDVLHVEGALVWRVDRANATRSRLARIVGTDFYKQLTIRNSNTVRKIESLMAGLAEG
jgi:uncharacterized protein (DUF1697 family)